MTFKVKMCPTKQTLIQFQKCQAEFDATSVVLTFSKSAWKQKKQHTPLNTEIITFVSSASVGVSTTAKMLWSLEPSSTPAMGRWMIKAQNCDYDFKNDDNFKSDDDADDSDDEGGSHWNLKDSKYWVIQPIAAICQLPCCRLLFNVHNQDGDWE